MKNANDVLNLGRTTAKQIKAARADGSIDWKDIPKAAPVIVALREAVKDAAQIKPELAAATAEELQAFVFEALGVLGELAEAIAG